MLSAVYSRSEASAVSFAKAAGEALKLSNDLDVYFHGSPDKSLEALFASDCEGVIIALPIMKQPDLIRRECPSEELRGI